MSFYIKYIRNRKKKWWNESLFQSVQTKAYEEELKRYEDKERAELDKARLRAQEAVSHYYDVLCSLSTMREPPSPPPLFTTSYQCLGHWSSALSVSHIHLRLETVMTGIFYSCTEVTTLKELVSVCVVVSANWAVINKNRAVCESAFVGCNLECFYEKMWKIEENIDCISFVGMLYWKLTNFSLICKHQPNQQT